MMKRQILDRTLRMSLCLWGLLGQYLETPIQASQGLKNSSKTLTFQLGRKSSKPLTSLLLPSDSELVDKDAYTLYKAAIKKMEERQLNPDKLDDLARLPLETFDIKRAEAIIQEQNDVVAHMSQASYCGPCEWPYPDDDTVLSEMRGCRALAYLLAIKAQLEISKGDFAAAIDTLSINFAMARHLDQSPYLLHSLNGIGFARFALEKIETFIQQPNAPNLFDSLNQLPRPFFDLEEKIQFEYGDDPCNPDAIKVQLLNLRFQRHVAALICIEALRRYTGENDGEFPKTLAVFEDLSLPQDLATRQPFNYHVSEDKAILSGPIPTHGRPRDRIYYEIYVKKLGS